MSCLLWYGQDCLDETCRSVQPALLVEPLGANYPEFERQVGGPELPVWGTVSARPKMRADGSISTDVGEFVLKLQDRNSAGIPDPESSFLLRSRQHVSLATLDEGPEPGDGSVIAGQAQTRVNHPFTFTTAGAGTRIYNWVSLSCFVRRAP